MNNEPHNLLWRDQLVAMITEVDWSDHPWLAGKFVAVDMAPRVREILEWIDRESKSDDGLTADPPFAEELLNDWYIETADGTKTEIMIPILDFTDGTIEWR